MVKVVNDKESFDTALNQMLILCGRICALSEVKEILFSAERNIVIDSKQLEKLIDSIDELRERDEKASEEQRQEINKYLGMIK